MGASGLKVSDEVTPTFQHLLPGMSSGLVPNIFSASEYFPFFPLPAAFFGRVRLEQKRSGAARDMLGGVRRKVFRMSVTMVMV